MKRTDLLLPCLVLTLFGCSEDRNIIVSPGIDDYDACPDDNDKTEPGQCGCGTPDVDENENGIVDCVESGDVKDNCPDDDTKTEPGQCGCGTPDIDENENGIVDCVESGDVEDKCPDDPHKTTPGKCGCGTPDTAENIADPDNDGVISCYDQCPNNPNKTIKDENGCEDTGTPVTPAVDTDGDTVPDSEDACPNNPNIKTPATDGNVDCSNTETPDPQNVIEVRTASDLETVRTKLNELLAQPTDGQYCSDTAQSVCLNSKSLLECRNGVWRSLACGSCTDNKCSSPENTYGMPPRAYTIRIMNNINLADGYQTATDASGACYAANWKSIPYVNSIRFEAVDNAVISFTQNGVRCALPEALIHKAVLSEFTNLTLDFDMTASAQASLLDIADSTTMNNVVYKGTLNTQAAQNVGGIIAETASTQDGSDNEVVKTNLTGVICSGASINAEKATVVGGVVGRLSDAILSSGSGTHQISQIKGLSVVGGIIGEMTSDFDVPVLKSFKSNVGTVTCTSSYCGGAIGSVTAPAEISDITSKVDTVNSNPAEYTAGFAGAIYVKDDSMAATGSTSVTNVTSEITQINAPDGIYVSGFAAFAGKPAKFSSITSTATTINGPYFVGGFFASADGITAENIGSKVTNIQIKSSSNPSSFLGGFAAEINGGTYSKIASSVTNLTGEGTKSTAAEDENTIGGFVGSISDSIVFENIYSAAAITANNIFPGGFIGKQETSWTTPNAANIKLTNIVSLSSLYSSSLSKLYYPNAISGALTTYTANNAYFLAQSSENALAKDKGNGSFTGIKDTTKATVLSTLQASWNGWKAGGTVTLKTGSFTSYPTFDAGNGI